MVSSDKLKSIRKKYEEKVYELFDDLDNSGFNSDTYKQSFSKMSDRDFIDMCKIINIE